MHFGDWSLTLRIPPGIDLPGQIVDYALIPETTGYVPR
jgi:hypothetical protein